VAAPPIRVVSPATGELLAEVPDEGAAGVASAVQAARAATPEWASRPLAGRVEALKSWRDLVLDDAYTVAGTLVAESGKPRHEAEVIEILYLCELIRFARRLEGERPRRPARRREPSAVDPHGGDHGGPPAARSARAPRRAQARVPVRSAVSRRDPPRFAAPLPPRACGEAARAALRRSKLVSRVRNASAFGRRRIPPRGVAPRMRTTRVRLPRRALRAGRFTGLGARPTSDSGH